LGYNQFMKLDKLIIFCDGGAANNPGPAAAGVVFYNSNGKKLLQISKYLSLQTNNHAEYQAVILALKTAQLKFDPEVIEFYLDSQLVVEQLSGNYKVKNQGLKPLHLEVKKLQLNFPLVFYHHITREKNQLADRLVKNEIKKNIKKGDNYGKL